MSFSELSCLVEPTGLVFVESTLNGAECSRRVREARGDEKPAMIATDIQQLFKGVWL